MEELLPHFERELAYLRGHAKSFAERYPKIAGRLMLRGDIAEDPHIERVIESFALLAARIHKRLDDDFPLFTETFLNVLYPHYLRPFPSCSIAQFDLGSQAGQLSSATLVERGSILTSRPIRGVTCKFRTTQDLQLLPIRIEQASYKGTLGAQPMGLYPKEASSVLSLQLELQSSQADWRTVLGTDKKTPYLRLYLDGEPSSISVLREALCRHVCGVMVQTQIYGPWLGSLTLRPRLVGFDEDQALIHFDDRSHPGYRLLTEYFAFPDKFNFIDIPLPVEQVDQETRLVTLQLPMQGIRSDSDAARLLDTISAKNFLLGCTPVVNLFQQPADPIRLTHAHSHYPVLVDSRRAYGYEVYSIDRVYRVKQTTQGESIEEFKPFFSLCHDDILSTQARQGCYWHATRDSELASHSPGYETEISIVDSAFNPAIPQTETLSLVVTSTNRDLPSLLSVGMVNGDLFLEGGSSAQQIRLIRKPTASTQFERGHGALWRLISHLSLNHLTLSGGGIDSLKELLRLYNLPGNATNRRQIDSLIGVDFRPATAWLAGQPFPTFVKGTEIRLVVDPDGYVGTGVHLLAAILDHFFAQYVHANSFTQLTILSARNQEEILKCPPRNGRTPLV